MGGGGGIEYLKQADGILDTWEFLLGCYTIIYLLPPGAHTGNHGSFLAWVVIIGLFMAISFFIILTKIIGCFEIPKTPLMVIYIIAAIVVFLTACICFSFSHGGGYSGGWGGRMPLLTSLTMAIFYAYSAYNTSKG